MDKCPDFMYIFITLEEVSFYCEAFEMKVLECAQLFFHLSGSKQEGDDHENGF